jgi:subtilisin family serine protease
MAVLLVLALAGPASAQGQDPPEQCTHPASTYSSGGSPGSAPANDPLFKQQWGLTQIKAPAAWSRNARGAGTVVAVVDSGVDYSHPDLQGKLLEGADFVEEDTDNCAGAQDEDGHGTHVAGIAAAVTNNGVGVAGTATDAQILPVRVLNDEGEGEVEWIVKGIRYAADQGAHVINVSLGDPVPIRGQLPNQQFEEAVNYAWSKGSVVVAAAGNESTPACSYPAAAENAVCVAATDRRGAPSFYSNFPADPDGTVGVRAPGGSGSPFCEDNEDIWSTFWPDANYGCEDPEFEDQIGYETLAGTSQATPFVSGLAAMLRGMGLSNAQVLECLKTKSSNRGSYNPVTGYGIVDADAATQECSPQSTAAFTPPPGSGQGGSGQGGQQGTAAQGLFVSVRVHRTTRRKLRRTGRLRVTVRTNRATTVGVFAHMTRSRKPSRRGGRVVGRRRFVFTQAGSKKGRIRLDRQARRALRRRRGYRFQVRWEAESLQGIATPARR